jgi:hypothetical protein
MRKIFLAIGLTLLSLACKESGPSMPITPPVTPPVTPPATALGVKAISPTSGPDSTSVTITGGGFGTTAANDSVLFDGHLASISTINDSVLVALVPLGAGTGAVLVKTGGKTATGPLFTYVYTYTVTTLAGGVLGDADGTGTAAKFNDPFGIACDTAGNVIVADDGNNKIRMVTPAGVVTTIAGSGMPGFKDGPASMAEFLDPPSVAVDPNNNVLVADVYNYKIRKISGGNVSTVVGSTFGEVNGPVATAQFEFPGWLTVDAGGNIFVADGLYIREISGGSVSTLFNAASLGSSFTTFIGIAVNQGDTLYLTNFPGDYVYSLTGAGVFSDLAGSGLLTYEDGTGSAASFSSCKGLTVDGHGNVLVADEANQRIRMITPGGSVTTVAGSGTGVDQDGTGSSAGFYYPEAVAVDKKSGTIYVLEPMSNRIRKITVQ